MSTIIVPVEIFSLIIDQCEEINETVDPSVLSMFKTCQYFYSHVTLYYCRYTADFNSAFFRHNTPTVLINGVLHVPNKYYAVDVLQPEMYNLHRVRNCVRIGDLPASISRVAFARGMLMKDMTGFRNLTHITFSDAFDQPVDGLLPSSITHLTFGYNFNQLVDDLPPSITHLRFGGCFNRCVDHLPPSIRHLKFGFYFNQTVEKLPPSITHLKFGFYFNQTVEKLPSSITHLKFGFYFNQTVEKLPSSITHLKFGRYFVQEANNLPPGLKHLQFGDCFNRDIKLPPSITHIVFGQSFTKTFGILPSVTHAVFHNSIGYLDIETLLPSVTHLTFGEYFGQLCKGIPATVTHLKIGRAYSQRIVLSHDSRLESLILHKTYILTMNLVNLPLSLKTIQRGDVITVIPDR